MTGIENITGRIQADVQGEIDRIQADARAEAEKISASYAARADRECADLLSRGEAAAQEQARRDLHEMARDPEYAIIYLTEQLAAQMPDEVDKYKDRLTPAVILIPGKAGSLGIGMENITSSVERAVGADIL